MLERLKRIGRILNPKVEGVEIIKEKKPTLFLHDKRDKVDADDIIASFEENGYQIVESIVRNGRTLRIPFQSPHLGIVVDDRFFQNAEEATIDRIEGLKRPIKHTFEEAFDLNRPVVAKDTEADRGEAVIYLKDKIAVAKFAAWRALFYQYEPGQGYLEFAKRTLVLMPDIIGENWEAFRDKAPEGKWVFQDVIETPSDFYTSFRILADGYGTVHYGTILRSREEKGKRKLGEGVYAPADEGYQFLLDPDSRLFLDAPNIVSNARQGGVGINLSGHPEKDDINRQVLIDHGIDPDNPTVPQRLEMKARTLGVLMKGTFPFIGVDFIYDKDFNDYFLETNKWPTLFAEGLGVTQKEIVGNVEDASDRKQVQKYLRKVLIGRMAATIKIPKR